MIQPSTPDSHPVATPLASVWVQIATIHHPHTRHPHAHASSLTQALLSNLEAAITDPEAVGLIEVTLRSVIAQIGAPGEEPPSLRRFGNDIRAALRVDERLRLAHVHLPPDLNLGGPGGGAQRPEDASQQLRVACFHPWGTDSGVIADVRRAAVHSNLEEGTVT